MTADSLPGRRILIVDGHPDPDRKRLVHALADAYADGAEGAGFAVRRLDIASIDFPLLRAPDDWLHGTPVPAISAAQEDIRWAEHVVLLYPLWHGDVPALLKGFLEQVLRPGFALEYRDKGLPAKLLKGRTARVVVTMGMPALFYRWVFSMHSLKSLERNVLKFVGFSPVHHTLIGGVDDAEACARALEDLRALGADGS